MAYTPNPAARRLPLTVDSFTDILPGDHLSYDGGRVGIVTSVTPRRITLKRIDAQGPGAHLNLKNFDRRNVHMVIHPLRSLPTGPGKAADVYQNSPVARAAAHALRECVRLAPSNDPADQEAFRALYRNAVHTLTQAYLATMARPVFVGADLWVSRQILAPFRDDTMSPEFLLVAAKSAAALRGWGLKAEEATDEWLITTTGDHILGIVTAPDAEKLDRRVRRTFSAKDLTHGYGRRRLAQDEIPLYS